MCTTEDKTERIEFYTTPSIMEWLKATAASEDVSVEDILSELVKKAIRYGVRDEHIFHLDDEEWQEFQEILNRPVKYKPRLARLLFGENAKP